MTLTLTYVYDLDLHPLRAMVMTYSHAKDQGQVSQLIDRVDINGRTDKRTEAIALLDSLMRSVK